MGLHIDVETHIDLQTPSLWSRSCATNFVVWGSHTLTNSHQATNNIIYFMFIGFYFYWKTGHFMFSAAKYRSIISNSGMIRSLFWPQSVFFLWQKPTIQMTPQKWRRENLRFWVMWMFIFHSNLHTDFFGKFAGGALVSNIRSARESFSEHYKLI